MKYWELLLATVLSMTSPALASTQVERLQLPNGLTVLVRPEPRLPLVNVTCIYKVGGANERPGITGTAHYIEHMAFRATENVSKSDITGTIERIGGRWNGYTWIDQTLYASTVPKWALDAALRIEAERMSRALFDPTDFERERTSVIAELQGYENDPASILYDLTVATSFEIHPYRYNVIGWLTDVLSIRRQDAYDFYLDFYGPNNAVLAVVGDVDPSEVRQKVEEHFGDLRPSPLSTEVRVVEPPQKGEKRLELRYPGSRKNLFMVFRAPRAADPDFPTLLVLDAVLAGGRGLLFGSEDAVPSSPLQRAIESAGGLAATTTLTPSRAPYVYGISVSSDASSDLRRLEESVGRLIDRLGSAGPTETEIERARRQIRSKAAYEVDTLGELAHRLAYYEALGSWKLTESILTAVASVTPADIRSYVGRYLRPWQRTIGGHVPGETRPTQAVEIPETDLPDPVVAPPSPVPERALQPLDAPPLKSSRKVLPNGVVVRIASRDGQSTSLRVRLAFGSFLDPPGKEGLALLADRTVLGDAELTSRLAELGAEWSSSADSPTAYSNLEYFDLQVRFLPDDLQPVVFEVARALGKRRWESATIERVQGQVAEETSAAYQDATWIAEMKALELVDPTWRPPYGTAVSMSGLRAEDVDGFLSSHLVGGAVTVALAGPGDVEALSGDLHDAFGRLPPGEAPLRSGGSRPPEAAETEMELVAVEGKTQSEIVAALPGVERSHPDRLPIRLLNYVVGETGYAGRLGKKLVDTGLTYSVYAVPRFGRLPGPILIQTACAPANLEETVKRIESVLRDLATEGVDEREWRESRAFRLGRLTVEIDSVDALALALVEAEYFGEDPLDFAARSKQILDVSRERLNEAAARYLRPELLRVGVAGAIPGGKN